MTARAVFVGGYRMGHAIMAFQFDKYLDTLDLTYIITNIDEKHYLGTLSRYGLDPNRFQYVNDEELIQAYPAILKWDQPGDYRGTWLRQQALKIACLDYFDHDKILIQDPDTFAIKPYKCFDNHTPNFFVLPRVTQSTGYYWAIEKGLGIKRQTKDCFVSEFMPYLKQDWLSMRELLETKHSKHFLNAIIDNCQRESGTNLIWFSEYEYLANYALTQRLVNTTEQKRFEVKKLDDIVNLNAQDYNCYVDACPNLNDSIRFDFVTNTVIDFDQIYKSIETRI